MLRNSQLQSQFPNIAENGFIAFCERTLHIQLKILQIQPGLICDIYYKSSHDCVAEELTDSWGPLGGSKQPGNIKNYKTTICSNYILPERASSRSRTPQPCQSWEQEELCLIMETTVSLQSVASFFSQENPCYDPSNVLYLWGWQWSDL